MYVLHNCDIVFVAMLTFLKIPTKAHENLTKLHDTQSTYTNDGAGAVDLDLLALSMSEDITDQVLPLQPSQVEITPPQRPGTYPENEDSAEWEIIVEDTDHSLPTPSSCDIEQQFELDDDDYASSRLEAIYDRYEAQTASEYHEGPQYTEELLNHLYELYAAGININSFRGLFLPQHTRQYEEADRVSVWSKPCPVQRGKKMFGCGVPSSLRNVWSYCDSA